MAYIPPALAQLETGSVCQLKDTAALKPKADGKGPKHIVKKNKLVKITERREEWTAVELLRTKRTGYMKTAWLEKVCKQVAAPKDVAAVQVETIPAAPAPEAAVSTPSQAPPEGKANAFGDTYKIKIAVMDLTASKDVRPDLVTPVTRVIPQTLEQLGPFKAVSSVEIREILAYETAQQMLGCDNDECLGQLGDALGADFMISGSLTQVGNKTVIQLSLANTRTDQIDNRITREHLGEPDELFAAVENASKQLVRDLLGEHSGTLLVAASEEGATIAVDGSIIGVTPMQGAVTLAGGSHTLAVEKKGFVIFRRDVKIIEDNLVTVEANLIPSADFVAEYKERASLWRWVAYGGLGLGGAALITSIGLIAGTQAQANSLSSDIEAYNQKGLQTSDEYEDLGNRQAELARIEGAAMGLMAIGVAAAAAGGLLWYFGDDPDRYDALTRTGTEVSVGPGAVNVKVSF